MAPECFSVLGRVWIWLGLAPKLQKSNMQSKFQGSNKLKRIFKWGQMCFTNKSNLSGTALRIQIFSHYSSFLTLICVQEIHGEKSLLCQIHVEKSQKCHFHESYPCTCGCSLTLMYHLVHWNMEGTWLCILESVHVHMYICKYTAMYWV